MYYSALWVIHISCLLLTIIFKGCTAQQKNKYRGCYEFHQKSSLVTNYVERLEKSLTPNLCVDVCVKQKFAFAGLDNLDCRCGHHVPSDILKRSDAECNSKCPGNTTVTCGGKAKVSVYETGVKITQFIHSRIYYGCFKDANPEYRVLKGSYTTFPDNTPQKCHQHCYDTGFKYIGLTYMSECFCGDTFPAPNALLADSECDSRCSGDAKEFCGGGWKLSVYGTGITDISEAGRFVGCFKDYQNTEVKPEFEIELPKSNTNRRCLNICNGRGFKFSGILNKSKCGCMNQIPPLVFIDDDSSCSTNECPGDATEVCGGKDRVKIFRTPLGDLNPGHEPTRLGCYQDQTDYRLLDGTQVTSIEKLTSVLCIDICKNKKFEFAGVEAGNECFCSHTYPSPYTSVRETECRTPCSGLVSANCGGAYRITVFETGLPHPQGRVNKWYMGCYRDDNKDDRMLKGSWQKLPNNCPDVCHRLCLKSGFQFFGLTWIEECFCGDEYPSEDLKVPEIECSKECGGDSNKKCGGGWRLSVYRTGLADIPGGGTSLGCFVNDGSLLTEYKIALTSNNKPKRCVNICDQLGYLYSGVQQGFECRCGFRAPSSSQHPVNDTYCRTKCPGDSSQTCGGKNRIQIYRTTVREEVTSVTYMGTITEKGSCRVSNTSKNGKQACKNEIVFEDTFSTLKSSTWKHTIKMSPEPDLEFVTYSPSEKVTFVKSGILFIKPLLQTEDYVYGKETLANCTGDPESEECSREQSTFNILPPVLSGQITTEKSFSFRYGRIVIKAKMPIGDWIVPQIWLTPKDSVYGPKYQSGQIRIAMARGNKELSCADKKLGNKVLESGIYFGLPNEVQHFTSSKELAEGWSSKFHEYSLVWSPDNLSFYVDGKLISSVFKKPLTDTIGSVTKSSDAVKYLYQEGSKLAPFDKEFYITIGVSVGGITDFPDGCTSGGKMKPWSNGSPKAMYNFWEKSAEWNTTWTDENVALQVDNIQVEAI